MTMTFRRTAVIIFQKGGQMLVIASQMFDRNMQLIEREPHKRLKEYFKYCIYPAFSQPQAGTNSAHSHLLRPYLKQQPTDLN